MASNFLSGLRSFLNKFNQGQNVVRPTTDESTGQAQRSMAEQHGFLSPVAGSTVQPQPTAMPTATPTPTPAPAQSFPNIAGVTTGTGEQLPEVPPEIATLLMKYFAPEQQVNAARVAFGESSYDPTRVNPKSNDIGLFQINPYWQRINMAEQGVSMQDLYDLEQNIKYAAWLQSQQGWNPWAAARPLGLVGGE